MTEQRALSPAFADTLLGRGLSMVGGVSELSAQACARAVQRPWLIPGLSTQIVNIGLRSISIVILTAVFSAMVMTVQFALQLARFGAKGWVGTVIGVSLARELAPVLTALTVGGRVGAGIAAELGSMTVTEQVEAMRALGADPVKKLVVPRVLAAMLVLEAAFGVPGLVAAPIYCAWLVREMRGEDWV